MENKKAISVTKSIFSLKCPRCREGDLFKTSTLSYDKPFEMPERCPVCAQKYMLEPGFYYGAMFISYVIWAFFSILLCLALVFYFEWSVNGAFALLIAISAISFVWIFRISRSLWIHINVKYKKDYKQKRKTPLTH